jgi:hypothetical protein
MSLNPPSPFCVVLPQACLTANQIPGLVTDAQSYVVAEGDNVSLAQKACRDLVFQLGTWRAVAAAPTQW